jgi:hypothetical protein
VYSVFYSVYSVLFNIFYSACSACISYSVLLVSNDYSVLLTLLYSVSVFNFNSVYSVSKSLYSVFELVSGLNGIELTNIE